MTDNEIVKALEGTSYHLTATKHKEAIYEAIDLIKRQKAENSNLSSDLTSLQNDLISANAEIERLRKIVGFTPARGSGKSPLLNAVLDNVRAEAYREFAERFKVLLEKELSWCECVDEITKPLDNLLKELVGEDDG